MMNNLLLQGITGQLFGGGGGPIPPGTIQLGTPGTPGGGSLGLAPFAFAYDYSFSAWIIEASELSSIGGSVDFTSLELYFGDMSDPTFTMFTNRIYMAHIGSKANWTGALPTVDMSSETLTDTTNVKFSFSRTYTSAELNTWMDYSFGTNFTWNGTDNIVIWWENRDGSYDFGGPRFDIENKTGSVAYKRTDTTYPSGGCSLDTGRPIMKLNYE